MKDDIGIRDNGDDDGNDDDDYHCAGGGQRITGYLHVSKTVI